MENKANKQKNIIDAAEIKSHLTELYHLQVSVSFCIDEKVELPGGFLIYDEDMNDGLMVKTRTVLIHGTPDVELIYSHMGRICRFSSRIVAQVESTSRYSFYRIEMPEFIATLERRTYLRVNPSEEEHVYVEFPIVEIGEVLFPVLDISGGGLAFLVPEDFSMIEKDAAFSLKLTLQGEPPIKFDALVMDIAPFLQLQRVGIEFVNMAESDRAMIFRYVFQKQREAKQVSDPAAKITEERLTIVLVSKADTLKYQFLKERNSLKVLNELKDPEDIIKLAPDIVILDLANSNANSFINTVQNAHSTAGFPVLVVGSDPKGLVPTSEFIAYSPPPFKREFVVRAMKQLMRRHHLFCRCNEMKLAHPGKNNGITVLVIDSCRHLDDTNTRALRENGYKVVALEGEDDLLSRAIGAAPDIIVMDERFEKTDLFSLCKIMSINKKLNAIPKLLATEDMEAVADLYEGDIVTDLLIYPFIADELLAKIEKNLHRLAE